MLTHCGICMRWNTDRGPAFVGVVVRRSRGWTYSAAHPWVTGADDTQGFIAFALVQGADRNYGWAQFTYDNGPTQSLTLTNFAYETTPEQDLAGCMVSDRYCHLPRVRPDQNPDDWPPPPAGSYWPPGLAADFGRGPAHCRPHRSRAQRPCGSPEKR